MREFDENLLKASCGSILNFWGSKKRYLREIYEMLPDEENLRCADVFTGGGSISTNLPESWSVVANDSDEKVLEIHQKLNALAQAFEPEYVEGHVRDWCHRYVKDGKDLDGFERLKSLYNDSTSSKDWLERYALITSGNSNIIRFNKSGEYTIKYGSRFYNPNLQKKMLHYLEQHKQKDITYTNKDFREINFEDFDFVISDSPYSYSGKSNAAYNENGGWQLRDLVNLMTKLSNFDKGGGRFMFFNEVVTKGKDNKVIQEWVSKYNVRILKDTTTGCSYNRTSDRSVEVLVTNF